MDSHLNRDSLTTSCLLHVGHSRHIHIQTASKQQTLAVKSTIAVGYRGQHSPPPPLVVDCLAHGSFAFVFHHCLQLMHLINNQRSLFQTSICWLLSWINSSHISATLFFSGFLTGNHTFWTRLNLSQYPGSWKNNMLSGKHEILNLLVSQLNNIYFRLFLLPCKSDFSYL